MLNKESVAEQNPWWRSANLIDNDEKVAIALGSTPNKLYSFENKNQLVLGLRQVGKTTYLKLAIRDLLLNKKVNPRNVLFYSADSLSHKDDIINLVSYFDSISEEGARRYIFLDEVSFVEHWNVALLALFNSGMLKNKYIYVTGSSSLSLQKEMLPGRDVTKRVFYPLSFKEYFDLFSRKRLSESQDIENIDSFRKAANSIVPNIRELNRYLDSYMLTGGYLNCSYYFFKEHLDPMDRFYETHKDGMLSELAKAGRSEQTFKELAQGIVSKYGSAFSANSIAKDTSIGSHKTVEEYLELMEKLFLIKRVYKISNKRVMFRSNKKVYFVDPFLHRVMSFYATGIKEFGRDYLPHVVEGVIGEHLSRRYESINYSRTASEKEVDFMYRGIGIEVKSGRGNFEDLYCNSGYILNGRNELSFQGKKLIVPISLFLYLIG